ncbi:MAG: NUDIX hydrolase [Candidatus Aenigmatarchaeota archaeon]
MGEVFVATKALILKNGKILVIKQKFDGKEYLDLPGGRMEYGLTPEENIKKEVKEELGVDVKIIGLVGVYQFFRFSDKNQVVCIVYLCEPISKKIDLNLNPDKTENIFWFKWVKPSEFVKLESYPFKGLEDMKRLVTNYFKNEYKKRR